MSSEGVKRWSIDWKATVKIGEFSRGGVTRGDHRASDHDMGCEEKYIPCGIVDEESAALHITFGSSGYPRNAGHSVASIPYREVLLALTRPWYIIDL